MITSDEIMAIAAILISCLSIALTIAALARNG